MPNYIHDFDEALECKYCGATKRETLMKLTPCLPLVQSGKSINGKVVRNYSDKPLKPGKIVSMPDFDPTKEFCPYCGLEIKPGKDKLTLSVRIVDGYNDWPKEYWHNSCRADFKKRELEEKKAKGWLRRFLEWIW